MRKIKFRAWDKEYSCMIYDICVGVCRGQDIVLEEIPGYEFNEWGERKNCIPLEYTGLKDKNDKEIYESDIVKSHGIHGEYVGEIVWERRGFKIRVMDIVDNIYSEEILEVIGNIYENSELFTERKKGYVQSQ